VVSRDSVPASLSLKIDHEIPDSNPELLYIFHLRQSTCLTGGKWWGIQGVQLLQKDIDILA